MTTTRLIVMRQDGSIVAQAVDGPDLAGLTSGNCVARDVWMSLRSAAGYASGTRSITLGAAALAVSREAGSMLIVRRASVTEGVLPRRLPVRTRRI